MNKLTALLAIVMVIAAVGWFLVGMYWTAYNIQTENLICTTQNFKDYVDIDKTMADCLQGTNTLTEELSCQTSNIVSKTVLLKSDQFKNCFAP